MSPHFPCRTGRARGPGCHRASAFTLVELLAVIALILILTALTIPAMNAIQGGRDVTRSAFDVMGVVEQARAYAMSNNTYVFVGFFEEDPAAIMVPRVAGVGRVVISSVVSADGTRPYPTSTSATLTRMDSTPTRLAPLGKLLKLENAHLERLADAALARPAPIIDQHHVGHADFAKRPKIEGSSTLEPNGATFSLPLGAPPESAEYTFQKILQFDPQGDITKVADTPARLLEIGLRRARGSAPDVNDANLVALQITGIGGQIKVHRK